MNSALPMLDPRRLPTQAAPIRPYPNESSLYRLMALLSVLLMVFFTYSTLGGVWLFILWGYVAVLCATSYLVSTVRGHGVEITAEQFPRLHQRLLYCCAVAGLHKPPEFYLLAGHGIRNAFATRFLNRHFVVLLSDIVDAFADDEQALNFYIGHEVGHIARRHLTRAWFVLPVIWLPLVGAAYSRAREYTCDQYGMACCASADSAVHALTVLAAGAERWKSLNHAAYARQARDTGGFWMSFNEILADYPWLSKRVARIRAEPELIARRHSLAFLLALLVPNIGMGARGAFIVYSYLAALAAVLVFGGADILPSLFAQH